MLLSLLLGALSSLLEKASKQLRVPPAQSTSPPLLIKRLPASRRSDVSAPIPMSPGSGAGESSQKGVKRQPEVDVVDLEEEIKTTGPRPLRRLEGMFWASDASETVVLSELVTRPEMWCSELNSVKFEQSGLGRETVPLGGKHVLLWKPSSGADDSTLEELPGSLVFEGMLEELRNLERCKTGRVLSEAEMRKLKDQNPRLRVISSRWVCARKNPERVRSRIVAKDLATGSARKQGFSSPTPSHDALMIALIFLATHDMRAAGADIGHAFMNSPLGTRDPVVLRMPMSISTKEGLPVFYFLCCALNGLRDASLAALAWLHLLSSLIKPLGLLSDAREPCLLSGAMWIQERWSRVIIVMYVDDLLIVAECAEAEKRVLDTIGQKLTVKVTGHILPSCEGGGVIDFLGRTIRRWPGSSSLEVGVRANYLDSCFEAYSVSKGTSAVPDIASLLDSTGTPGLTPEAYSKFRRVLGKVLWLAQTRQDLKLMVGLISTQQAEPTQATESALRALLRFLHHDRHVVLHLPSPALTPEFLLCSAEELLWKVHVFADASHAPYRFLGRRGITGGAICFAGSLVRSMAKTQGVVCLSSCEAELHALQFMAQESVAFVHLLERVLIAFGDLQDRVSVRLQTTLEENEEETETCESLVSTEVLSDSQAGLDVIAAEDVPRRSRRIEIRLAWLRLQVESGRLSFRWIPGEQNPSDLLTKNVGTKLFLAHRLRLGFDEQYGQLVDALHLLAQLSLSKDRASKGKLKGLQGL